MFNFNFLATLYDVLPKLRIVVVEMIFLFRFFFLFPSHTFIFTVNETQQLLRGE